MQIDRLTLFSTGLLRIALICPALACSALACFAPAWHSDAKALEITQLEATLDRVLDTHPTAKRTTVALKVVDLQSGEVLYNRFGDRLFTPASNLKIYSSACALDTFGPKHPFLTRATARVLASEEVIATGITLVGGGDAMLSSANLRLLADRLVDEWKLQQLHGKVVVDNSRYSDRQLGPGWMWDDQPYYYNMRVTPLMLDFNVKKLPGKFDADGDPVRRAVDTPSAWIAEQFTSMLRERGVQVAAAKLKRIGGKLRTISHDGPPLWATLKHFNHESENAVGEVLLHEIAIANGIKRPTWSDGSSLITKWLQDTARLEPGSFKLVDGSGLSRYNLISADSSVRLLAFMRKHQYYQTFLDSLPDYEVDSPGGKKQTLVRAKSGGMSGVSTISGYVQTLAGRQLAFSLLANGFTGSSKPVQALRGKVWQVLTKYKVSN